MNKLTQLAVIGIAATLMVACDNNDDDDNDLMPVDNSSVPVVMQPDVPVVVVDTDTPVVDQEPIVVPDTPVVEEPVVIAPPVVEPPVEVPDVPVVDVDPPEEPVVDEPVVDEPVVEVDPAILEGQAVAFVEANIFNTVTAANLALSPQAIVFVRDGVVQSVPRRTDGWLLLMSNCEAGDARATNAGDNTMYRIQRTVLLDGNLVNGSYSVFTNTEVRSGDTRFKFDDDFDLTVEQEGNLIHDYR